MSPQVWPPAAPPPWTVISSGFFSGWGTNPIPLRFRVTDGGMHVHIQGWVTRTGSSLGGGASSNIITFPSLLMPPEDWPFPLVTDPANRNGTLTIRTDGVVNLNLLSTSASVAGGVLLATDYWLD